MRRHVLGFFALLTLASSGLAQPIAPPSYAVEITAQEEQVILEMCEAAVWAARIKFTGTCDYLKDKFAKAKAPKPATAGDPPK